jgi:hypothetical protein
MTLELNAGEAVIVKTALKVWQMQESHNMILVHQIEEILGRFPGVVRGAPPHCLECGCSTDWVRDGVAQCLNDNCRMYGRAVDANGERMVRR